MSINIVTNAQRYDWQTWLLGIMRSFLSGGAAALTTGSGAALVGIPSKQIWFLMGINFVVLGLYRLGEFLQLHGAPDALQQSLQTAADSTAKAGAAIADAQTQVEKEK